ncbi:hypothetical protein GO755_29645 [Spirosoma sp. HMF4905]|uniref:Carboxypeptidase regulatory-like domain-containing protein n=1 Tax=Spirosoma arboris TaxID=2682092 RepID=A0A7K1SK90_9BACT|nr:carboxypeptidase-like regulatory domain-containing protein [Spirosoma arboris]MVM34231.1 hypothetical protein [Spirosoma arboris]
MAVFQVFVTNSASQPLSGVAIRLLAPDGTDITATRFGASPVYTDANGLFTRFYLVAPGLTAGIYSIIVSASGYTGQTKATANTFTGLGNFNFTLLALPTSVSVEITEPESGYVSPMAPVEFLVPAVSPSAAWEYIEATVTSDDSTSVMEVPVINGQARLNLQARLELEPLPHLVGDGVLAIADADFSKNFSIDLASLTETGSVSINEGFTIWSANAFPSDSINDLTSFTNIDGLADWLTPWEELPVFTGHYADAMIWLPIPSEDAYELITHFLDINQQAFTNVGVVLPNEAFSSGKVARIRIPEPVAGAHYALLTVTLAGVVQTKPLKIRYIYG